MEAYTLELNKFRKRFDNEKLFLSRNELSIYIFDMNTFFSTYR